MTSSTEKINIDSALLQNAANELNLGCSSDTPAPPPVRTAKDFAAVSLFCLLVAFGGFVFGFDTGTISGFVNMASFKSSFGETRADGTSYLSNVRVGLIISIFNVGCAVGGIFLSKIGDVWGRRSGLLFAMVVYVVGITVQIASGNRWYQFFIGRLITGLGVGTVAVLSPLLISEVAPKQVRGTLVFCYQLCTTLGILIGGCVTFGTKKYTTSMQWRTPLILCYVWATLLLLGMAKMPESPRYLVEKGKVEEAKRAIAKSNNVDERDPEVEAEMLLIQAGVDREALAGSASWTELITGKPKIFRRVIMGIMLNSLQQLTGVNYFFYYGTTVFQAVGLDDSFVTSIILGVVNFLSTFVGIWAIERFGRRFCLLVGSVAMFLCFIVFACIGSLGLFIDGYSLDASNIRKSSGAGMIFVACVFIFFFASTWAGGVFCIVSESYPTRIRAKAMAVATAANWMWGFLIAFFTPFITSAIHFYYGFVFAGCLLFSLFYVYFFVAETKGLSLEEVDELYACDVQAWRSSSWKPVGYEGVC